MRKLSCLVLPLCLFVAFLTPFSALPAAALTSGYYTYTVSNNEATITDCDSAISGAVTIPSTLDGYPVTSIGDYAFTYCFRITSVTISEGVRSIGIAAFEECSSLASVTISSSSIGDSAFCGNYNLKSVTILEGVTSIGKSAFASSPYLTSVTIPASVRSIGRSAFCFCSRLTALTVVDDNMAYCSVDGVLFNKDQTNLSCYPAGKTETSYAIPTSVTNIEDSAFYFCTRLTSVTIPTSVTSIEDFTFYSCANLTSVAIPSFVTSIGNCAFRNCTKLTAVTIPPSVTNIGDYAFDSCSSLASVTISEGVTSIGNYAFTYCTKLTSAMIPSSVTNIGNYAFYYGCTSLTSVKILGNPSFGTNVFPDMTSNFKLFGYAGSTVQAYAGSNALIFSALTEELSVSITGLPKYAQTLTACTVSLGANPGTITYLWRCDTNQVGTEKTYTVQEVDIGKSLTVTITVSGGKWNGSVSSAALTPTKAEAATAPLPVTAAITTTTVTLVAVEGCEYRCDTGGWQASPVFEGLIPNHTYRFTQRFAETDTQFAGAESAALWITTDKTFGDTDGDGEILISDLTLLAKYLSGWDVSPDMDTADCDSSGGIDIADLTLLAKFLAGWDVTLGG